MAWLSYYLPLFVLYAMYGYQHVMGTCPSGSQDVMTVIMNVYDNQIEHVRRGVPQRLANSLFLDWLQQVRQNVVGNGTQTLEDKCVNDTFVWQHLESTYDLHTMQQLLERIDNGSLPVTYLPRAMMNPLPAMKEPDKTDVADVREWAKKTIGTSAEALDEDLLAEQFKLLYDKNRDQACLVWNDTTSFSGAWMDARSLTEKVASLVLQLHMMGVAADQSAQLLYHHIMYVFNGVRCTREQGDSLWMPCYYGDLYAEHAARLLANVTTPMQVPLVNSTSAFATVMSVVARAASSYETWGWHSLYSYSSWQRLGFDEEPAQRELLNMVINDGMASDVRIGDVLLSKEHVNAVKGELGLNVSWTAMSLPGRGAHGAESLGGTTVVRSESACSGDWVYMPRTDVVEHALEYCCAPICEAVNQLLDSSQVLNICCARCNQFLCETQTTDQDYSTSFLATVIVSYYGTYSDSATSVMI